MQLTKGQVVTGRRKLGVVVDVHRAMLDCTSYEHRNALWASLEHVLRAFSAVPSILFADPAAANDAAITAGPHTHQNPVCAATKAAYDVPQVVCVLSPDPLDVIRMASIQLSSVLSDLAVPCFPSYYQYQYHQPALCASVSVPGTPFERPMKRCDLIDCVLDVMEDSCDHVALVTNSPFLQLHFSDLPGCRVSEKPLHVFAHPDARDLSRVDRVAFPGGSKAREGVPPHLLRDHILLTGIYTAGPTVGIAKRGAPTIGPVRALALLERFGSIDEIVRCAHNEVEMAALDILTRKRVAEVALVAQKLANEGSLFRPNKNFYLSYVTSTVSSVLAPGSSVRHILQSMVSNVTPTFTEAAAEKLRSRHGMSSLLRDMGSLSQAYRLAQMSVGTPVHQSTIFSLNSRDPAVITSKFDEVFESPSIDVGELETLIKLFPNGRPSWAADWCRKPRSAKQEIKDPKTAFENTTASSNEAAFESTLALVLPSLQFDVLLFDCSSVVLRSDRPEDAFKRIVSTMRHVAAAYRPLDDASASIFPAASQAAQAGNNGLAARTVPVVVPVLNPSLKERGKLISQLLHGFGVPAVPRPADYARHTSSHDCRLRDVLEFLRHGMVDKVKVDSKQPATRLHLVVNDGEPHVGRGTGSVMSLSASESRTRTSGDTRSLALVPCKLAGVGHGMDPETYRWYKSALLVPQIAQKVSVHRLRELFVRFGSYQNLLVAYEETRGKAGRKLALRRSNVTINEILARSATLRGQDKAASEVKPSEGQRKKQRVSARVDDDDGMPSYLSIETIERLQTIGSQRKAVQEVYVRNLPDPQAFAAIAGTSADVEELFLVLSGYAEEVVASAAAQLTRKTLPQRSSDTNSTESPDGPLEPLVDSADVLDERVKTYLNDARKQQH